MSLVIPTPRQERSRRTLEQLLDAAVEVLSEKSFESATAAEIAARAGFTVGAFYGRFPSKDALWVALTERIRNIIRHEFDLLSEMNPGTTRLDEAIREIVATLARMYTKHRCLGLAVRRPVNTRPDLAEPLKKMNKETMGRLTDFLRRWKDEIQRPDAEQAIEIGLLMVATTLREALMMHELSPRKRALNTRLYAQEMTSALSAYLGVNDTTTRRRRSQ
jgi:AcrR family transcriptional regulator